MLVAPPTERNDGVPDSPTGDWGARDIRDAPAIDVSWHRQGTDVLVTFARVSAPKPLDCRWLAEAHDDATGSVNGWANFTDRQAWIDNPACMNPDWGDPPGWVTDPRMELTDSDGDHSLSAGDYLTVRGIALGEETTLKLSMGYWGSWLYRFSWAALTVDSGI